MYIGNEFKAATTVLPDADAVVISRAERELGCHRIRTNRLGGLDCIHEDAALATCAHGNGEGAVRGQPTVTYAVGHWRRSCEKSSTGEVGATPASGGPPNRGALEVAG